MTYPTWPYSEDTPEEMRRYLDTYYDSFAGADPRRTSASDGITGKLDLNANLMQPLTLDQSADLAVSEYRKNYRAKHGVEPFQQEFSREKYYADGGSAFFPATSKASATATALSGASGGDQNTALERPVSNGALPTVAQLGSSPSRSETATQSSAPKWDWGPIGFVKHYYFGKGKPVNLSEIGLATQYEQSASVQQETEKFMNEVLA
ncbi:MAG: hypothetical protein AB7S41_19910 [Parvibaculaceae bacterium]